MPAQKFIGIEIGGTKLQLAKSGSAGTIERCVTLDVDPAGKAIGIRAQIEKAILPLLSDRDVAAIGIGFGGPVDYRTGQISVSHQVEGWEGFSLKEWMSSISGLPVLVDNDANVAALGEATYGAGKDRRIVFYMTIGSGIGGGLVKERRIYHGAFPGEVEIGHVRLDRNGDTLESRCSGWAVDQKVRERVIAAPSGMLANLVKGAGGRGEARFLKDALEQKDRDAIEILDQTAGDIAFALSHVVHLFHPEILVIGGGLSLLGDHLVKPVTAYLPRYVMSAFLPPPPVVVASLGKDVVPLGALELAKSSLI